VKKERFPPANQEDVFTGVNEIREGAHLSPLVPRPGLAELKDDLQSHGEDRDRGIERLRLIPPDPSGKGGSVAISLLSAFDVVDEKMSTFELLGRWMAHPGKRPVLLAPGNYGYVEFEEQENGTRRICLIVAYIYE
jgi:hypothetical protein